MEKTHYLCFLSWSSHTVISETHGDTVCVSQLIRSFAHSLTPLMSSPVPYPAFLRRRSSYISPPLFPEYYSTTAMRTAVLDDFDWSRSNTDLNYLPILPLSPKHAIVRRSVAVAVSTPSKVELFRPSPILLPRTTTTLSTVTSFKLQ